MEYRLGGKTVGTKNAFERKMTLNYRFVERVSAFQIYRGGNELKGEFFEKSVFFQKIYVVYSLLKQF